MKVWESLVWITLAVILVYTCTFIYIIYLTYVGRQLSVNFFRKKINHVLLLLGQIGSIYALNCHENESDCVLWAIFANQIGYRSFNDCLN